MRIINLEQFMIDFHKDGSCIEVDCNWLQNVVRKLWVSQEEQDKDVIITSLNKKVENLNRELLSFKLQHQANLRLDIKG